MVSRSHQEERATNRDINDNNNNNNKVDNNDINISNSNNQLLHLCTARTVLSDPEIRTVSVRSGKFTTHD